MTLKFSIITLALSLSTSVFSQAPQRTCGTLVPPAEWDAWFNQEVEQHKLSTSAAKTKAASFVLPVVIHVIHGGQPIGTFPNLPLVQLNSQISILNKDFGGIGFNVGNAPPPFAPFIANCNINFALAQKDPNDNPLPQAGIDRIDYVAKGWTNPSTPTTYNAFKALLDNTIKPNTIWDPTRYFNIWVCDINPSVQLLGYATFPVGSTLSGLSGGGTATDDGIVIWSKAFGNIGFLDGSYNKGRTATHETGHYLGLRHIWGDGICGNDFCQDTPPQRAENFGCPTYPLNVSGPNSCAGAPNGAMFMNFMDYCNDPCLYMFTEDQKTRMHTALTNAPNRNQLTASSATLTNAAAMPVPAYAVMNPLCYDSGLAFENQTTGTPSPTYSWSVNPDPGVIISNSSATNPTVSFPSSGFYTISLVATNSVGTNEYENVLEIGNCVNGIRDNPFPGHVVTLAPNPSSGMVKLIVPTLSQPLKINVYNAVGQLVSRSDYAAGYAGDIELNLSTCTEGIYNITLSNADGQIVRRMVLAK